jgi:hypothetical protein
MIRLASKPLVLAVAILLAACASNKEASTPADPSAPPEMTASFVDGPDDKTPLLARAGSFFSKLLPSKKKPAPAASPVQWAGEIRMVNLAENFVLLESTSAVATIPGEKYTAIRDRQDTGVVRMTSLRNPPFLIADIVSGDPSPGDKIHLPRPTAPMPSAEPQPTPKPGFLPKFLREILPTTKPKQ